MGFVIRWVALIAVVTLLGTPFASRQFAAADDVVSARGKGPVAIEPLSNDRPGFLSAVRSLAITEPPSYGTVDIAKDGTMTYRPTELVTVDAFTYQAVTTSGGKGTARVVIQRQPGKGVSVTAPVDLTAGGAWWWWVVVAAIVLVSAISVSHLLRSRSFRRHLSA